MSVCLMLQKDSSTIKKSQPFQRDLEYTDCIPLREDKSIYLQKEMFWI